METNLHWSATINPDQLIRIKIKKPGLLKVEGTDFTATLQTPNVDIEPDGQTNSQLLDSDFTDLTDGNLPARTFTPGQNHENILYPGIFGLKFSSSTGVIAITVMS